MTVGCCANSATVASNAAGVCRATTAAWSRLIRPSRSAAAVAGSSPARRASRITAAAWPRDSPARSISQCSGERRPAGLPGPVRQDGGDEVDEPGVRVVQVGGQGRDVLPVLLDLLRGPALLHTL